jgi:hypothetical protein
LTSRSNSSFWLIRFSRTWSLPTQSQEEEAVQGKGRSHVPAPRLLANNLPTHTGRSVFRGRKEGRTAHQRTPPANCSESPAVIEPVLFRLCLVSSSFRARTASSLPQRLAAPWILDSQAQSTPPHSPEPSLPRAPNKMRAIGSRFGRLTCVAGMRNGRSSRHRSTLKPDEPSFSSCGRRSNRPKSHQRGSALAVERGTDRPAKWSRPVARRWGEVRRIHMRELAGIWRCLTSHALYNDTSLVCNGGLCPTPCCDSRDAIKPGS